MYQVLFYSRSGNTQKVADAIAEELGVKAQDVKSATLDKDAKIVFLGSGRYAGKPGLEMMQFIESNDLKGMKVAFFSTFWFSRMNAKKAVETTTMALQKKGATVLGSYGCKGKFTAVFNRGRPNHEDLEKAKKFAKDMVGFN
jgi:flavodoxin